MRKKWLLLLSLASTSATLLGMKFRDRRPLDGHDQLIIVTTENWNSISATLRRFERNQESHNWKAIGEPIKAVVGRKGLGWGIGNHDSQDLEGPVKREGDGRSPAGIFDVSYVFGHSEESPEARLKMPFLQLVDSSECVDDVDSREYNRVVDRNQVSHIDWNNSEKMKFESLYRWGAYISHNSNPPKPGSGSCIFMHIWRSENNGTSGCTAMEESDLVSVLTWMRADARPALVQMPIDVYNSTDEKWSLPILN